MANLNLNKVILGGRLTADVELKQTQNGISVCTFNLAVGRKVGQGTEQQTDFITCVAWRQAAEFISKYFKKGSSLCIVGNIQTRTWTDQNQQKRYATEVIVNEAMFVDSKNDGSQTASGTADTAEEFEPIADTDDLPF